MDLKTAILVLLAMLLLISCGTIEVIDCKEESNHEGCKDHRRHYFQKL